MWYLFGASQSVACVCVFNSSTPWIIYSSKVFPFSLVCSDPSCWTLSSHSQRSGDHLFPWRVRLVHPFRSLWLSSVSAASVMKAAPPTFFQIMSLLFWSGRWDPDFQPVSLHLASVCPSYPLLIAPGVLSLGPLWSPGEKSVIMCYSLFITLHSWVRQCNKPYLFFCPNLCWALLVLPPSNFETLHNCWALTALSLHPTGSCRKKCFDASHRGLEGCRCDVGCKGRGDCCWDFEDTCVQSSTNSESKFINMLVVPSLMNVQMITRHLCVNSLLGLT